MLYTPIVKLEAKTKEAEEGASVYIKCNVTANPNPITVEWVKDGKPDFRQSGDTLRLSPVTAENSGTYICRAVNILSPSGFPGRLSERIGNESIALLIRHKPGRARIMPDKPVATEGSAVTLTCTATPPGWPAPQYRWFKIGSDGQTTILATGTKYTIPNANLGTEGMYNCQATNELGMKTFLFINFFIFTCHLNYTSLAKFFKSKLSRTWRDGFRRSGSSPAAQFQAEIKTFGNETRRRS